MVSWRMATLFLLVGLPGSGKTTLASQIERDRGALVLSADDWMSRIVRDGWDAERRVVVQEVQFEIALKVLRIGGDVVLDFGLFHRRERDHYRAEATAVGAEVRTIYLDVPKDELLRRLAARNANLPPHTFAVDEAHLDNCISWLEPPTPEELVQGPSLPPSRAEKSAAPRSLVDSVTRTLQAGASRRAQKRFLKLLPSRLAADYGHSGPFTPEQVESTIRRHKVPSSRFAHHALAIFCDRESAERVWRERGLRHDYGAIRSSVGAAYFGGDAEFTARDVGRYAAEHSGSPETAHAGHDAGGVHGHGDGGHH